MGTDIKLLHPNAKIPTRAKANDAGYDLYSLGDICIEPGQRVLAKTGISVAIPSGYYGRIAPRSGLAVKHGLDVLAGVCDASFRGEIMVVLINHGDEMISLLSGSRIAQLIIEACHSVEWNIVDELPPSDRQDGGFGSSGS